VGQTSSGARDPNVRIVIAPDKFAGTLSAGAATAAIADGWAATRPGDELRLLPMSDGGPGFCAVLHAALEGSRELALVTTDPLGRPVPAAVLLHAGTAYVESAQAVGLARLTVGERDPEATTSYGLGALLIEAVSSGAQKVVVGLGGSATNDGGQGLLQALADSPDGADLPAVIRALDLVIASDVANPLLGLNGATAIFGPQKGASREAVARLEGRMQRWVAEVPGFDSVADLPGAGAAGGLGAALLWLGGRREPGAELVAQAIALERAVADADLVITGEGTYDATSLRGKVVGTVAAAAQEAALPCVVLAGQLRVGRREAAAHGVDDMLSLAELAGSVEAATSDAARWLSAAAAKVAAGWGPEK
jgi:glycerate 2-kinase